MEFNIPINYIENLSTDIKWKENTLISPMIRVMNENKRYSSSNDIVEVSEKYLTLELAQHLCKLAMELKGPGYMTMKRQLESWVLVKENPQGAVIKSLKILPQAIKQFMLETCEYKYVFSKSNEGFFMPFLLTKAKYVDSYESGGQFYPANVQIQLAATKSCNPVTRTLTVYARNLSGGRTIFQIFEQSGYYFETDKLLSDYDRQFANFLNWRGKLGMQFLGIGTAQVESGAWYSRGTVSLVQDDVKTKLVIDTDEAESFKMKFTNTWWNDKKMPEGEEDDGRRKIPVHPYLKVYDLINHRELIVHSENLEEYEYKTDLKDKLVLPQEHLDLIDVLSESSVDQLEDIVEGKTGGVIVICTGPPGVGKTLTAEVYAEVVKKPLYIVQSSQLGVTPAELENQLKTVLKRAQRWGAILLIDESDVYIHERGNDIVQNAVVGVFLRVLEYYNGIMFMTSNRSEIIDDAIKSRATAEIQYKIPDVKSSRKIWEILLDQFEIELSHKKSFLDQVTSSFQGVSGRDIKSLLKLGKLLSVKKGIPFDVDLLKKVSKFKTLSK